MVFAALMAGGSGTRMGLTDVPKQFMTLGGRPMLIITVERFLKHEQVSGVVVMCPKQWVDFTAELIKKHLPEAEGRVFVSCGGKTRNETLERSVSFIYENLSPDEDAVILTHDAVRPFVTERMISENIEAALEYGACNTVVPATDTIAVSRDGRFIDETPDRSLYYHSQTPQSFRLKTLAEALDALSTEQKEKLTDACMIFTMQGRRVFMVRGEQTNIKITWPGDIAAANAIIQNEKE